MILVIRGKYFSDNLVLLTVPKPSFTVESDLCQVTARTGNVGWTLHLRIWVPGRHTLDQYCWHRHETLLVVLMVLDNCTSCWAHGDAIDQAEGCFLTRE